MAVRLGGLVALGVLFVADVYANVIGDQSYVAGGDCGGKSCRNPGTDRGYKVAVVIAVLMLILATWPVVVRRIREEGASNAQ